MNIQTMLWYFLFRILIKWLYLHSMKEQSFYEKGKIKMTTSVVNKRVVRASTAVSGGKVVAQAEKELAKLKKAKKKTGRTSLAVPPVEIKVDKPDFIPTQSIGGTWHLMANVCGNVQGERAVRLSHRNSHNLDCGFTAKVPEGFKMVLELTSEFKDKGLEVYNNVITGEARVGLSVRNLGREIVVIRDREVAAFARIEPLYNLSFEVKNDDVQ
jgi:hypothetical protein